MRAGNLDRRITLQRYTRTGTTPGGAPLMTWTTLATVRAQIIEANAEEFQRAYGEGRNTAIILRIRWMDGLDVEDRVTFDSKILNIRSIRELGRRRGLELRCEEVRE